MDQIKNRHLRRTDRLGDRLQNQISKLIRPYIVTEDHIMLREGKWIIEDDVVMQVSNTIKDVVLPRRADYWIIEDQVIIKATDTIRDDILSAKRDDYIVIQDDLMLFGNIGIRDDILRMSKSGWIIEDNVMIMVAASGVFSIASIHHSEPAQENRSLFLVSYVPDDRESERAYSGFLKGDFDKEGKLKGMRFVNKEGKEIGKVSMEGELVKRNDESSLYHRIIIEDNLMLWFGKAGDFAVGLPQVKF